MLNYMLKSLNVFDCALLSNQVRGNITQIKQSVPSHSPKRERHWEKELGENFRNSYTWKRSLPVQISIPDPMVIKQREGTSRQLTVMVVV